MKIHYSVAANPRHLVTAYFSMLTLRKAYPDADITLITNLRQEKFLAEALGFMESVLRISVIDTELEAKSHQPWPRYVAWAKRSAGFVAAGQVYEPILWSSIYAAWLKSPKMLLSLVEEADIALPIDGQKNTLLRQAGHEVIASAFPVGEQPVAPPCFVNRYGFIEDNWLCLYHPHIVARQFFEFLDGTGWDQGPVRFCGWGHQGWQPKLYPAMEILESEAQTAGQYKIRGIPRDQARHPIFDKGSDWDDQAKELADTIVPFGVQHNRDPIVYCAHKTTAFILATRIFQDEYNAALDFADRFKIRRYVDHAGGMF